MDPGSSARNLAHLDLVQQLKRGLSLSEGAGLDFIVVTVKTKNESYCFLKLIQTKFLVINSD